jgi:RNA polymerase sigma factor (sigma-70 family)
MDAARREPELEALLRESAWVRGLARGLLGEGAAADDLAQDVLVAALDRRPGLEGARLRGWLRTVARRLALRARERGGLRARAERESSRRDDADRDSERRLELQRELTAALGELEPADRTVLVLRYFDGLSTGALARHLEIAEPAARKRLSRALERLRERLDRRSGGDRTVWSLALAGLLVPRRARTAVGATALGGAGLLLSKATWTLVVAAVFGALLLGLRRWSAPLSVGPGPIAESAPRLVDPERPDSPGDPLERAGQDSRTPAPVAPAVRLEGVRVVDAIGDPVRGARVAWLDGAGVARAVEVGEEGEAGRPPGSEGARFFAGAEGHGFGFTQAESLEVEVLIRLPALRTVSGRVLEEGEPPREPILLRCWVSPSVPGVSTSEFGVSAALRELGILPGDRSVWSEGDGTFRIDGLVQGIDASLILPSTHRLLSVDGRPAFGRWGNVDIAPAVSEVQVDSARVPTVRGRMVWDDTGDPVHGSLTVVFSSRISSSSMITNDWLDDSGRFAIGIPIEPRALAEPLAARGAAVTEHQVSLRPDSVDGEALPFEHVVELDGVAFPLDVGILRIPRAPTLHVRVTGPEGEPIAGAAVVSELARGTTDDEGRVALAARSGRLLALAIDHSLAVMEWDGGGTSDSEPFELRLSPGATLEVVPPAAGRNADWSGCSVRIAWDESPFEGAGLEGPGRAEPMPGAVFRGLFGRQWFSGGFRDSPGMPGSASFVLPAEGPLLVPGWRAGGAARLELLDAADHAVGAVELRVPDEPRRFLVDLDEIAPETSRLRLRAVSAAGRPLEDVAFALSESGRRRTTYVEKHDGVLDLAPVALGAYTVTVRAAGHMEREFEGLEVTLPPRQQELVLEPARSLRVALRDASGRPLRAERVELHGTDRTWETSGLPEELVGSVTFWRLPFEALELEVAIGARTWRKTVAADATEVDLELPAHGRLALDVAARERLATEHGYVWVRLRALEGEGALEDQLWVTDGGVGPSDRTYDLLPGRYALELDLQDVPEDSLESDPPLFTPLLRREVEVRAGETCEVSIGP